MTTNVPLQITVSWMESRLKSTAKKAGKASSDSTVQDIATETNAKMRNPTAFKGSRKAGPHTGR